MGLLEAFVELCETEGPIGEIATHISEAIFECGNRISDALDEFVEKLDEIEAELAGKDGEESCWVEELLSHEWEKAPKLKATRNSVDSTVNSCETVADKIIRAALNLTPGDDE